MDGVCSFSCIFKPLLLNFPVSVEGYSIFVANLPMDATVDELIQTFSKFGAIKPNGVQVRSYKVGLVFILVNLCWKLSSETIFMCLCSPSLYSKIRTVLASWNLNQLILWRRPLRYYCFFNFSGRKSFFFPNCLLKCWILHYGVQEELILSLEFL